MTKTIRNALSSIERAIGIEAGDDGGDAGELAHGDAHDLVPVYWGEEAKELLRRMYRGRSDEAELLAALDEPHLARRIDAEGSATARGRRHLAEFARAHAAHLAVLKSLDATAAWRASPPTIDLQPATNGGSLPVPWRWNGGA